MIRFFFLRLLPTFILAFLAFAYIRTQYFKGLKKKSFYKRELILYFFAGYLACALVSLLTPGTSLENQGLVTGASQSGLVYSAMTRLKTGQGISLKPFTTILNYHKYSRGLASFLNLWGNIILFIPYGFLLKLLFKKYQSSRAFFATLFLTTVFIESAQLFVNRSVDIDDVILNLLGGFIGALLYKEGKKIFPLKRYAR